jgi:hypothetical protein
MNRPHAKPRSFRFLLLASCLTGTLLLSSCAGLSFQRATETSGTFTATGMNLTFLTWDFPKRAIDIARENASDANLANMEVTETFQTPHLGWFNWILEILSIRYARLSGTWGFSGE